MLNQKFKTSQICLLFLSIITVTKIVSMPSFLVRYAGRSLWISALLCFLLDLGLFILLGFACKKYKCTFYSLLCQNFGKITAKIIMVILAVFFLLKAQYPILEEKFFVENTFYEEITTSFVFYPFILLAFYLCFKGLKLLKRTSFIMALFSILGIILLIILTYKESKLINLLPLFQESPKSIFLGSVNNLLFCGEGIYLLFFIGRTDFKKGLVLPLSLCLIACYISVIVIIVLFFGVFGEVSMTKIFSLSQMSHYSLILSNIGRLDSIASFMLDFARLFALSIPLILCAEALKCIFGETTRSTLIVSGVICLITFIFILIFNEKNIFAFNLINKYLKYFFIIINYLLPPFIFCLKEKNEKLRN